MASKTKPVEPKIPPLAQRAVDDPDDQEWHREARARWSAAEAADPETPFLAYRAPALPAWSEKAPAHVTRELLGRFLQDRDTQDAARAIAPMRPAADARIFDSTGLDLERVVDTIAAEILGEPAGKAAV